MSRYEEPRYQSRAENRSYLKSKVFLTLGILGLISSAISGYTIYDRNRFSPTSTLTSTAYVTTRTPAFTPTPMHPFPSDVKSCTFIPPDQQNIVTESYQGRIRVKGSKIYEYLVGSPDKGEFRVLFPGQQLPSDFNDQTDQLWLCRRTFEPIPASPTP